MTNLAVIRIRGTVGLSKRMEDALRHLNLKNKNNCIVLEDSDSNKGAIQKVQNYVTWGEIDSDTLKLLKEKRGTDNSKCFKLNPPRKGFEKGGIRKRCSEGGALGYRGENINGLLRRMI